MTYWKPGAVVRRRTNGALGRVHVSDEGMANVVYVEWTDGRETAMSVQTANNLLELDPCQAWGTNREEGI